MIGQVENITRFGLFVKISTDKLDESTEKLADKAVSKNIKAPNEKNTKGK